MSIEYVQLKQTLSFRRVYKKLHEQQRELVDDAIRALMANPLLGEAKVGDLVGIRIYKFNMNQQLTLLAYTFAEQTLTLLALGPRENFYRSLKQSSRPLN